jgi:hypothetical protein
MEIDRGTEGRRMTREISNVRGRWLLVVVEAALRRLLGDVPTTSRLDRTVDRRVADGGRADSRDAAGSSPRPSLILTIDQLRNL